MTLKILLALHAVTSTLALPPGLLSAVCYVESHWTATAINPHDGGSASFGVCQVKYETAQTVLKAIGPINLMDPEVNIKVAGTYLKHQIDRYPHDVRAAVAAYNAGKCRYNNRKLIMNRRYVAKVFKAWGEYK